MNDSAARLAAIREALATGHVHALDIAEAEFLLSVIDELAEELGSRDKKARKRWVKKQEAQLGIRYADFRAGKWEMELSMAREMAAAYTAMAKTMLGDAPNYTETRLEFDTKIAESPEIYTLVVQRHAPGALTPHEARQKAERERDAARAEAEQLRAQLDVLCGHAEQARLLLETGLGPDRRAAYDLVRRIADHDRVVHNPNPPKETEK